MTESEAKENESWVADFTCSEARNGIVEITIDNLDTLHVYRSWGNDINIAETIFMIHCDFPHTNNTLTHLSNRIHIENFNISVDNQIYVKFPMYFNSYDVNVSISGRKSTNDYFPISKRKTVHIPSFLSHDDYKIGEMIRIRHPTTKKMITGHVMNILHDNMYQINYKNKIEDEKQINLPISSIYPKATDLRYTLKWQNLNDYDEINMNLYCYKYDIDEDKTRIIESLFDFFERERMFGDACETWLKLYLFYDRYYLETLSNFLVKNICDFIFEIEYEYHIDCMMDKLCGKLKFDNMQKYYLGQNKFIIAHCDCCGLGLNEWDFAYFCDGINGIQHQICVLCIATLVDSWEKLKPLLCELLNDQLNNDCIKTITDYVVGRVIALEYFDELDESDEEEQDTDYDNDNDSDDDSMDDNIDVSDKPNTKRKLMNNNDICNNEPPSKRQKLNDYK
eukprot:483344_1